MSEVSIEELKAKQEAHRQEMADRSSEKEEQKRQEQENLKTAGEGLHEREYSLRKIEELDRQARELEQVNIQHWIDQVEMIKTSRIKREEEIGATNQELGRLEDTVVEIKGIIGGAKEGEIHPDVKQALEESEQALLTVKAELKELTAQANELREQEANEELVKEYRRTKEKMVEAGQKVAEIEANPAVISLLMNEAKSENEVRERIVDAAISTSGYGRHEFDDEYRTFVKGICQRFIQEELQARGINDLQDPEARRAEMNQLATDLVAGLNSNSGENMTTDYMNKKIDRDTYERQKTGFLIKNLVGKYGHAVSTANLLETRYLPGYGEPGPTHEQALRHLETINYIKSSAEGYPPTVSRDVASHFTETDVRSLGDNLSKVGFESWGSKPIYPKEADETERAKINKEYERSKTQARKRGREALAAKVQETEADITGLKKELEAIDKRREDLGRADKEYREIFQLEGFSASGEHPIAALEKRKTEATDTLIGIQSEIREVQAREAGFFKRPKKQRELRDLENQRQIAETRIKQINHRLERARECARLTGTAYTGTNEMLRRGDIERAIKERTGSLPYIRKELNELDKAA